MRMFSWRERRGKSTDYIPDAYIFMGQERRRCVRSEKIGKRAVKGRQDLGTRGCAALVRLPLNGRYKKAKNGEPIA
jgi:hypothetical protein